MSASGSVVSSRVTSVADGQPPLDEKTPGLRCSPDTFGGAPRVRDREI